jgi:cytidylate kinase
MRLILLQGNGMHDSYLYNNITISGLPGSGSTTMLDSLREALKFDGWVGYSGGGYMRDYAKKQGLLDAEGDLHHSAGAYPDDFDLQVDMDMRTKLQTESRWILESWLSGFLAQQVPGTLKILMKCSDKSVRVDRIVNRDGVTPDKAIANMNYRYEVNAQKWRRMYKEQWQEWVVKPGTMRPSDPIDFWHQDLYDLVIDTFASNQQESLERVVHVITQKK